MTDSVPEDQTPKKGPVHDEVLRLSKARIESSIEAFSDTRTNQLADLKFAAASPDNDWQWPEYAAATRTMPGGTLAARPKLTINKLPQHIRQVTNEERQNRPMGKVIPADGGADVDMAEVFNGMVRSIQNNPEHPADIAYDTACENQVTHGEGYWRIITDWVDERSFVQEAYVEDIPNSFSVYMDPGPKVKGSGEGAQWAAIADDMPKSEFEAQFPDATPLSGLLAAGINNAEMGEWMGEDTIRIAEYYCYENTTEMLYLYADGAALFESEPEHKMRKASGAVHIQKRKSTRKKVRYYKINGYEVLEERDWPGKYIPIIRVIGNAFIIEGKVYYSGLVRNAKDAQRMYNYHASQEVEMLALAPKAPFIGVSGQFEGHENKWNTANTQNWPYLEYNQVVDDATGQQAPPPQRAQPPMVQAGIIAAKQAAAEDIKATTGQYNASLGQQGNERSGVAIRARQNEGDTGTFHYIDNLARAIRWTVCQLIDLIPKLYDTPRIARIIGEDNETSEMVELDPDQPVAVNKVMDEQGVVIKKIYNPGVGKYDVVATTGPGYASKRQESVEGMIRLIETNPALMDRIGDKVIKAMDWPESQSVAKQFKRGMDPKLFADDDDPALQQANQQIEQMGQQLQQAMGMLQNAQKSIEAREIAIKEYEAELKGREVGIKEFDAQTKRLQVMQIGMTPDQVHDVAAGVADAAIEHQAMMQMQPPPVLEEPPMQEQMPPQQEPQQMPGGMM